MSGSRNMQSVTFISNIIMPLCFLGIIIYGYSKKINIYQAFIDGANDGLKTVLDIFPTLVGLIVAVGILRESGALDFFSYLLKPVTNKIGFPEQAVPLVFMKLFSSSASTSLLLDIFKKYGPDSFIGRLSSIMMYCTETIFYTISIYFMSINIKKIRYTLKGALIANLLGVIASFYIAKLLFRGP